MAYASSTPGSQPLKIGFRVGTFPKLSETFILSQIRGMVERGHEVSILADRRSGPEENATIPDGLHDVQYVLPESDFLANLRAKLPYRVRKALTSRKEKAFCRKCDVVVCNFGWFGAQMYDSSRSLTTPPKIITVFHGDDMSRTLLANGHHPYDRLIESGELLLPVSEFWKQRLLEFGADPNTIRVHRMGVQVDEFTFAPRPREPGEPLRLITVCRFVEKKGLEFAIRGVATALETDPGLGIQFELIGSGPLAEPLAQLVNELGLQDHVTFSGPLPHEEISSALARSDALILPSVVSSDGDMEGIPLSLMEAMASGVCVISTYHSGIPELIEHGQSGLLAEERDVARISEHILTLARDTELSSELARNARMVIENKFNSRTLNDELELICRSALQQVDAPLKVTPARE